MEGNLPLLTRLEANFASSILIYEVAIRPRIIRPLDLAFRIFVFAFPASKLAFRHPLITWFLLLCFSSAPFHSGFTPESFSAALNRALASSVYFATLGCAERVGATIPFASLGSWLCSSRIYWVLHYIKWIDSYFTWRRHSLLILFAKRKLRSIEEWLHFFGNAFVISVSFALARTVLRNWPACAGKAIDYLLCYAICWGMFDVCPWWIKWILICMFLGDVYRICFNDYYNPVRVDNASGHQDHPFKHKRLSALGCIRLLLLHPRHSLGPIKCSVIETSLEAAPLYEAISYTWGNDDKKYIVHMDSGQVKVPANLYNLLRIRSSSWFPRLLWIDSLSIDQADDAEKAQQIQLMGDIYRRAFVVSVCLGFHDKAWKATERGEKTAKAWGHSTGTLTILRMVEEIKNTIDAQIALDILEELRLTNSELDEATIWQSIAGYRQPIRFVALVGLIQNPWFARIWVVQEVALASSLRVCHGKRTIPWEVFIGGLDALSRNPQLGPLLEWTNKPKDGEVIPEPPNSFLNAAQIDGFRRRIQAREDLSFSQVLLSCHNFKATELRDNVFGILGMCSTTYADLMIPDYSARTADVYLNSARCVVGEDNVLALLSVAGIGYFPDPTEGLETLPSWVPDWSRPPRVIALANLDPNLDYNAGGPKANAEFRPSDLSLFVRGHVVDTIENIGPFMDIPRTGSGETGKEELKVLMKALEDSYSLFSSSARINHPYTHVSPAQPLNEVFLRTLIGDRSPTKRPAEPPFVGHVRGFERRAYMQLGLKPQERFKDIWADEPAADDKMDPIEYLATARRLRLGLIRGGMRRRFCVSEKGYVGLVPPFAREGDIICVALGVQTPLVFRKLKLTQDQRGSRYHLVGETYIHGLMDGEALGGGHETEFLEIV